jgi:3-hydroxymyristoyl/3-hydroxydecanoyl-(acyl carrier protein) dehydratase
MDPHFAAFSFVDRIDSFVPATRARGTYAIPAAIAGFPLPLVAEAIGQLAAWVSMEHIDFRGRPVAALATETRFHGNARPGDTLELAVEIDQCDDDAVAYHGQASVGGHVLVELSDCLGPMLPVEDFDDPAAMRARFALLRGAGAPPGRFGGVTLPALEPAGGETGRSMQALLHVPTDAPFFGDHFPRRPVFPATLLLHAQIGLAESLVRETGRNVVPARMSRVKVRAFTPPGQTLMLTAEVIADSPNELQVALGAVADGRNVATARLALTAPEKR